MRRFRLSLLIAAWTVAVTAGFVVLGDHATRPGDAASPPSEWPSDAPLEAPGARGVLLLVAHPQCPCTEATLVELAASLRGLDAPPRVEVVLRASHDGVAAPLRRDLAERMAALPHARTHHDPSGRDARRFGALTSGHVLLYAPDGTLRFSGGVTGARGHAGANGARFALTDALRSLHLPLSHPDTAPVYGCPLTTPTVST
jgi:hypothetical protein